MPELKDGGWGEKIHLGTDVLGLGLSFAVTVEDLYQSFKKRLMDELVVAKPFVNLNVPPARTNLILMDKDKTL